MIRAQLVPHARRPIVATMGWDHRWARRPCHRNELPFPPCATHGFAGTEASFESRAGFGSQSDIASPVRPCGYM